MSRLLTRYVDPTGATIIEPNYLDARTFEDEVAAVSSPTDGRVGLIDRTGRQVLDFRYDFIGPFVDGLAKTNLGGYFHDGAFRGGAFGLVASDGAVVLEPTYDLLMNPDDGRVTFQHAGKLGFLDTKGSVVVPATYAYASWHHEGLAVVATDAGEGYVDRDGELVIEPRFQEATTFESGIARVKIADRWGIIDKAGTLVHEPIYDRLGSIHEGACWAVKEGVCYVLTAAGTTLGGAFEEVKQSVEGGMWPVKRDGSWGLLRQDGSVVGLGFGDVLAPTGGLARVRRDDLWGFIDHDGTEVIPCKYQDAWAFEEERAAVKVDDAWTYIDGSDSIVGPGGFSLGNRYRDGYAPVSVDGRWGFMDRDGHITTSPNMEWLGYLSKGLACALDADRTSVPVPGDAAATHVLPPGGLGHAVFDDMGPDAHVIAVIGFARDLTDQEQENLRKRLVAWERVVRRVGGGKLYTEDKWVSPFNLYLRVQNLHDPRGEVSLLVDELSRAEFPVCELLFARWGWPEDEKVMRPTPNPHMPKGMRRIFDTFPEYWDAVWTTDGPGPASENAFYLRGALDSPQGKLCLEERHMPIWYEDVRVCMGALQDHGEHYGEPSEGSDRVFAALGAALERRFASVWVKPGTERRVPVPQTRRGEPGVEPVEYGGRTGYAFAFECGVLLHWFSSPRMRFREQELMDAIRDVVLELGLAPVILWSRFQQQLPMLPMGRPTVLVVNLFDPAPPSYSIA